MIGKRTIKDIQRNIETLADKNVQIVFGNIHSVNAEKISVTSGAKEYFGDFMIIAPGAETAAENYLDKYGYNFFGINGAYSFHGQLEKFNGGRIAVLVSSLPYSYQKDNEIEKPNRNAWLYIDTSTIGKNTFSNFAEGWQVNLQMACRLIEDELIGFENADVQVYR